MEHAGLSLSFARSALKISEKKANEQSLFASKCFVMWLLPFL